MEMGDVDAAKIPVALAVTVVVAHLIADTTHGETDMAGTKRDRV